MNTRPEPGPLPGEGKANAPGDCRLFSLSHSDGERVGAGSRQVRGSAHQIARRIVYVLKVFPKISETFVAAEMAELRRRGVELRILSLFPPQPGLRHSIVASAGLEQITSYETERFPQIVREFKPELIHAHFATQATAAAIELAAEHDVPLTFTAHGYDIHRKPPADFGGRAAAASAVVTVSEANASYISQAFGVAPSLVRVIPCGIDTERFRPAYDSHTSNGLPLIVCVARLVEVKNLGLLLRACALLRDRGTGYRCVLVGEGPCRAELEESRARLGLQEIVEMPGAAEQSDVVKWWQRATVAVLTSDSEGMPVSLMEAAACGVPAVATAVGGIPELVEEGMTGLLVPSGDTSALASALERIMMDGDLRQRLALAARKRAEERFSVTRQVDRLVELWSEVLAKGGGPAVFVSDPFRAASDASLPTLAVALDPADARAALKRSLPRLTGEDGKLRLKAIRVTRHKPGKRCVVEYEVRVDKPGKLPQKLTLIGKARSKRFGKKGYRLLQRLWEAGFDSDSPDGISVPEPIGVVPKFQMWFQRKVPGETATHLMAGPKGVELARRIAAAAYKLHQANVPTERRHGLGDELRILHECIAKVIEIKPDWNQRLSRVLVACDHLGSDLPEPRSCGIHRDFYPAQVIVHADRIFLIDFDLYCIGDPGLDIGNFIGHMTEQSLRECGNADALRDSEEALASRFAELSGKSCLPAVRAYTTLTLVRHIFLSTQFPKRKEFTEPILRLCEARLGLAA